MLKRRTFDKIVREAWVIAARCGETSDKVGLNNILSESLDKLSNSLESSAKGEMWPETWETYQLYKHEMTSELYRAFILNLPTLGKL